MPEVETKCGAPLKRSKNQAENFNNVPIEQWIYHIGSVEGGRGNYIYQTGGTGGNLTVSIQNNKVVDIKLNGEGMPASSVCNGNSVNVGDSASNVSYACGTPTYVNRTYQRVPTGQTADVEIWQIQASPYQEPTSLTFKNGILESIGQ